MRHANRGVAVLLAALFSLALVAPVGATEPPTTTGATGCDFNVGILDVGPGPGGYPLVTEPVALEPFQGFLLFASGLPPDSVVTLRFHLAVHGRTGQPVDRSRTFDMHTNIDGHTSGFFMFFPDVKPWDYTNEWLLTVSAPPGCTDSLLFRVAHTPGPFIDARGHVFDSEIRWAYWNRITSGCSTGNFCPDAVVTREQMASFLIRSIVYGNAPGAGNDFFTDDETSVHETDINRLAAAGVTTGCTATRFCPTHAVTREQMASFLVRAMNLPGTGIDFFTDDEASAHEADINALAASGITTGCTATTFCPTATVTRAQMTAFLYRAACCGLHTPIHQVDPS